MEILLLLAVGVLVGIVSALFGIGGGLLMVPFMVLVLGFDQHLAQGTTLAVIIPTAIAGAFAHHKRGFVEIHLAVWIAVGGFVGIYVGSRAALATSGDVLRTVFGVVVVALGVRFIVQGMRADAGEADALT